MRVIELQIGRNSGLEVQRDRHSLIDSFGTFLLVDNNKVAGIGNSLNLHNIPRIAIKIINIIAASLERINININIIIDCLAIYFLARRVVYFGYNIAI